MEFLDTRIYGIDGALIGMRLPMSKDFSEAEKKCNFHIYENNKVVYEYDDGRGIDCFAVDNDTLKVAKNLCKADSQSGSQPNSKFLRMIHLSVIIKAPSYLLQELSTYKVGTTINSTSLQHTGSKRDFTINDFEVDEVVKNEQCFNDLISRINYFRRKYVETKDYEYFRAMRQLIPMSYIYTIMFDCNYQTLRNMYHWRKNHKLKEWSVDFVDWCKKLPYFKEFIEN